MEARNYEPYVTLRQVDSAHRVVVRDSGLEHTHHFPFRSLKKAWALVREIRQAIAEGRDLNLAHWDTEILS